MPLIFPESGGGCLMAETSLTKQLNHSEKGPPDSSCLRNQFPGTIALIDPDRNQSCLSSSGPSMVQGALASHDSRGQGPSDDRFRIQHAASNFR